MYSTILKYQECDLAILKLNKKIENSEYKKSINSMVQKNKEIQADKEKLEREAKQILGGIAETQAIIKKEKAELDSIEVKLKANEIDVEAYSKQANEISFRLNNLLKKLSKYQKEAEEIEKKYEELKKNATIVKANYKKAKEAQDKFTSKEETEINSIEDEKKKLEKSIDEKVMQEYLKFKKDNIMPVYVKIFNGDCCGGCMQKLSTAQLAKKEDKLICEMCRRIIIRNA